MLGVFVGIFMFLLAFYTSALGVCRTISPLIVEPGDLITVSLEIDPDPSTEVIAVDDNFPSEFSLSSNPDNLHDDEEYHMKYLDYDNPQTTTVSYVLTSPTTEGTYSFSGIWMVDLMSDSSPISCDNQVQVTLSPPPVICSNLNVQADCDLEVNCTWCPLYGSSGSCIDIDNYECGVESCNVDLQYCHNCQWTDCQTDYTCNAGSCELSTTPTPTVSPSVTPSASPSASTTPGPIAPPCTPNWECSGFGACDGRVQKQTCTDLNSCGTSTGKPPTIQRCTGSGDPTTSPSPSYSRATVSSSRTPNAADPSGTQGYSGSRKLADTPVGGTPESESENESGSGGADMVDTLFYILIAVLVLMVGGFLFYYVSSKKKGGGGGSAVQNNLFANPPAGGAGGNMGNSGGSAPPPSPPSGPGNVSPPEPPSGKF